MYPADFKKELRKFQKIMLELSEVQDIDWRRKKVKNPATGRTVQVGSLTPKEQEKYKPKKKQLSEPDTKPDRASTPSVKDSDGETFDISSLPKNIKIPRQHIGSDESGKEVERNYRLNNLNDIRYAVRDGKVVGHLGVDDDGSVKAVYVDPKYRNQGIAEKLYSDYVKEYGELKSDDPDAMEPEAINLWNKLEKKYPDEVTKSKDGWTWKR